MRKVFLGHILGIGEFGVLCLTQTLVTKTMEIEQEHGEWMTYSLVSRTREFTYLISPLKLTCRNLPEA